MQLIQLFLPTYGNHNRRHAKSLFDEVRRELVDKFGGVTAFVRSPAVGAWEDDSGAVQRDDVMLFEVMADTVDRDWWKKYRRSLERRFQQEEVLIRATEVQQL